MGKGARTREQNAEKTAAKKVQQVIDEKSKKRNSLIVKIVSLVLAVAIVTSSLVYVFYYANGRYLRSNVVAETTNFEVDNAMMTYYVRSAYVNMQSQYGDYFSMFTGIDTSVSLQKQYYSEEEDITWFDYLVSSTIVNVQDVLALSEAALAEGIELSQTELDYIELAVQNADSYYLGNGISKNDLRSALELTYLAQRYTNEIYTDLVYTDDDVATYFNDNANTYRSIDYRTYTFDYTESDDEDTVTYTEDEVNDLVDELLDAGSEDEFVEILTECILYLNGELEDEELETKLGYTLSEDSDYVDENEFYMWAYEDERESGETYVVYDEDSSTAQVYYLMETPSKDTSGTVNIRNIIISGEFFNDVDDRNEEAWEVYDAYMEDPTEENFIALVDMYTADSNTMSTGGLYSNMSIYDLDDEMAEWAFDEDREYGDVQVFENEDSVNVTFFVSESVEAWEAEIISDLQSADYVTYLDALVEFYPTELDMATMYDIPI